MLKNSQLLNELITKEESAKKCIICFEKEAGNFALVPCGHTQFCCSCIEEINKRTKECSLCKTNIESVLKLYL
jgi:E3 ubiquitin-protein ligase NEURL3